MFTSNKQLQYRAQFILSRPRTKHTDDYTCPTAYTTFRSRFNRRTKTCTCSNENPSITAGLTL